MTALPPPFHQRQSALTRHQEAELRYARAREWAARMRPLFDQMDAAGAFYDSPLRHRHLLPGLII